MASRRKRSRTRSGANVAQRDAERLRSLTFFLDRQLGRYTVAGALRKAGAEVAVHDDHFAQDTADSVWLAAVGAKDWVVISKDENIRRNPLERRAYEDAKVRGFVVTAKGLGGKDLAELLVRALPGIVRRSAGRYGPFLFTISATGVFKKLL